MLPADRVVLNFLRERHRSANYFDVGKALASAFMISSKYHPSTLPILKRLEARGLVALTHRMWEITAMGRVVLAQ